MLDRLKEKIPELVWGVEGGVGVALIGAVGLFLPQLAADLDPNVAVPEAYSASDAIWLGTVYGGAGVAGGLLVGLLRSSLDNLWSAVFVGSCIAALALPLVSVTYWGMLPITARTVLMWLGLSLLIGGLFGRHVWIKSRTLAD